MNCSRAQSLAKFIFICLALMIAGPALATAPLCSQSLLRDDFYVASLHNLAEMKMNLDLQIANGRQSGVTGSIALAKVYAQKYSELVRGTSSYLTEKGVRELLQEHILKLQRTNKAAQDKESSSRAEVRSFIGPLKFTREADIPIQGMGERDYVSIYAPESNSVVLVREQEELYHLNLSTGKQIFLGPVEAAVAVRPNGKEIVIVTSDELKIVDLDKSITVFKKNLHDLDISGDFNKYLISLDERGAHAVISSNKGELLVLDLQTGAAQVFKGDLFGNEISSAVFADADHIFFHALDKNGSSLGIMNLDLKMGTVQPWLKTSGEELKAFFFAGGKRVILEIAAARNRYESHKISTSPVLDSIGEAININDGRIKELKSLPNSDVALVERFEIYNNRTNFEARDFRGDEESYFHFIEWNLALGIFPSNDGRSVYILVHDRDNKHLQVWKRE